MDRRHTGRARNPEVTAAVLQSALALAREHGPAITIDQIADRAGVSKATIYRRWDTKWDLLLDALLTEARTTIDPSAGLASFLSTTFAALRDRRGTGRLLAALMTRSGADPEFAATWREKFIAVRREALISALTREGLAGDAEVVTDMIYGAMWYRLLIDHGPLDEQFARDLTRIATANR